MRTHERLQIHQLCYKRSGKMLFKDFTKIIPKGSLLQIVGPNGVGKSTLLRLIAGLLIPDSGKIMWEGEFCDAFQEKLIYLDHALSVKSQLTVFENIFYDYCSIDLTQEKTMEVLRQFDLFTLKNKLCGQLSRGQNQRVALAKCLSRPADLYLLDEPLTSLDRENAALIKVILLKKKEKGATIIMASHQNSILPMADTLYLNEKVRQ